MGGKPSRRKSDGAGAQSQQKSDNPEAHTVSAEEAPNVDEIPREAASSEEPEDVLNKSMENVGAKMESISVEDPNEAVVPDPEAQSDSLMGFSQHTSSKIEFSSPSDPAPIPGEPLTTEDQGIPEAPEHGAETTVGDVEAVAMENEAVSGQEISGPEELFVCVNQDKA